MHGALFTVPYPFMHSNSSYVPPSLGIEDLGEGSVHQPGIQRPCRGSEQAKRVSQQTKRYHAHLDTTQRARDRTAAVRDELG